ncbi:polysaccharide biosynthesis tyrosine autokinase [Xylanimonas oleitrophica]|nr:polysaccharide biosynthesis tyrosine autokinase [Xylanimonas oleitrophica]
MDLIEYLGVLRKRWPVAAALGILGAVVGLGVAERTPPSYTATAKVFVAVGGGQTTSDLLQGSTYVKNLIDSYTALIDMPVVLDPVAETLGQPGGGRGLAGAVTAEAPLNTSIIEIKVSGGDPAWAARVADAVANQLPLSVDALTAAADADAQGVAITVVSPAVEPTHPSQPRTRFLVATGGGGGVVLGLVGALLWALLDTRLRLPRDLEPVAGGLPTLGTIPRARRPQVLSVVEDPLGSTAEAYRIVQTNLRYVDVEKPASLVVVTSSVPGEGKSTTARNLAAALAEGGRDVLMVDADMRRPSVSTVLGVEGAAGLTTVLVGRADLDDVVQPVGPGLDILPVGSVPPNPHQLVASPAMRALLARTRARYDVVILDAPPVLPVTDAAVLSTMADGTIVVVGSRRVRRQQLTHALRTLASVDARVLGLVMTFVPRSGQDTAYYGYGHGTRGAVARLLGRLRGRGEGPARPVGPVLPAERATVGAAEDAPAPDAEPAAPDAEPAVAAADARPPA